MTERNIHAEIYALALLGEEGCEIGVLAGKATRFGIDAKGPPRAPYYGQSAKELATMEAGDLLAAIDYAAKAGLIDMVEVQERKEEKLASLLDPASTDSRGERLAPPVAPEWEATLF